MIEKIRISSLASYTEDTIIDDLKKINFFYGANASGKTTITKVIANEDKYNNCKIEWKNNKKLKTLVFNEDFVKEYFYDKDSLSGIYTMGEGAKEIEQEIKIKNEEKTNLNDEKNKLENELKNNNEEKEKNIESFKESCWDRGYIKYKDDFDLFYTGYKNSKDKFAKKIEEETKNISELLDIEKLKDNYNIIYNEEVTSIDEISFPAEKLEKLKEIEDNQTILQTSIIGKKDVDIATMIEKLHNHDWVKQGKVYYEKNYIEKEGSYYCPFCQQKTTDDFKKQLEDYFDETYNQQMKELEDYLNDYKTLTETINKYSEELNTITNKYLDKVKPQIEDKIKIVQGFISKNLDTLEKKQNNPSTSLRLENISDVLTEIENIVNNVNESIKKHNNLVKDRKTQKANLDKEIWRFIVNELKKEIEDYETKKTEIEKSIEAINKQKKEIEAKIEQIQKDISDLEKKIKRVKSTVETINKILESFGFKGFKLKSTDDEKHYQIVRNDGSDAKKTLSEGERNFLVFLYFYHLIYGVENPEENINQDKILVIDDPVSSLDSEVLFIVSILIRDILDKVRKNNDPIKQVFIFTHNAYFFKEVTFISSRESCYNKRNDTMYYIVRKKENVSYIDKYETCPVQTSYQLLWNEIKKDNVDCISAQNCMRRIIEFYFKFLAGINESELLEKFNGEEKIICKSLIAWINTGSHEIIDDFSISMTKEQFNIYMNVFEKIFKETGHIAHYNMMMRKEDG